MPYILRARSTVPAENAIAGNDQDDPASSDLNGTCDMVAGIPSADAGSDLVRKSRRVIMMAVLGLVVIIIGSLATWATVAAHRLRADAADANIALVDQAATHMVTHDVTTAVNTIFSYNYADTRRTKVAAQGLLTGAAIRQYDALFALVERQAPKEKLVVTTRVTNIGVEVLTSDRARVLVFADQQDTRAGTRQTSYGGAMFAVTVRLEGGRWKIENIATFTTVPYTERR